MTDLERQKSQVIVGVGGAGKNVLVQMGPREGITRVYVNSTDVHITGSEAEEVIGIDQSDLKRNSNSEQLARLRQICEDNNTTIITGLAGSTGSRVLGQLLDTLLKCQARLVVFLPFRFEQQEHYCKARECIDQLESAKESCIHNIDLEGERTELLHGVSFEDFLHGVNEKAIAMALRPSAQSSQDNLNRVLSTTLDLSSPAEYVSKVRLMCRMDSVSPIFVDTITYEGGEAHYSGAIEGVLTCRNHFGLGSVQFRILGNSWSSEAGRLVEEAMMLAKTEQLRKYCQHKEAIIVSSELFYLANNDLVLMDPDICGVGIAYEELASIALA